MLHCRMVMAMAGALVLGACSGKTFEPFEVAPGAPSLSVDATQLGSP